MTIPWDLVRRFVGVLDLAHQQAGRPAVRITSWFRTVSHNEDVGGSPRSQHLLALAIDVVPDAGGHALAQAAQRQGLVVVDEGDHFHIQYARANTLPATLWV